MSFLNTLDISTSALTAERFRMDMISQNIANIDTTRAENDEPYRRRLVVFQEKQLTFASALEKEAYKRLSLESNRDRANEASASCLALRPASSTHIPSAAASELGGSGKACSH